MGFAPVVWGTLPGALINHLATAQGCFYKVYVSKFFIHIIMLIKMYGNSMVVQNERLYYLQEKLKKKKDQYMYMCKI